jgi:hypothetical protein
MASLLASNHAGMRHFPARTHMQGINAWWRGTRNKGSLHAIPKILNKLEWLWHPCRQRAGDCTWPQHGTRHGARGAGRVGAAGRACQDDRLQATDLQVRLWHAHPIILYLLPVLEFKRTVGATVVRSETEFQLVPLCRSLQQLPVRAAYERCFHMGWWKRHTQRVRRCFHTPISCSCSN